MCILTLLLTEEMGSFLFIFQKALLNVKTFKKVVAILPFIQFEQV